MSIQLWNTGSSEAPHAQGKRNPSKMVGVARHQKGENTLKPYSQKTSQSNHTRTTALSNSMKLSYARGATQDWRVMVERFDRMWSTGEGNDKPLQCSCLENPMNSMKRQNDRILKETPQVSRCPICYWRSVEKDGWMASLTRWMWVSVNSGSWWWTGRPGVLRFVGSRRVGHDWATDLIWVKHHSGSFREGVRFYGSSRWWGLWSISDVCRGQRWNHNSTRVMYLLFLNSREE